MIKFEADIYIGTYLVNFLHNFRKSWIKKCKILFQTWVKRNRNPSATLKKKPTILSYNYIHAKAKGNRTINGN